MRLRTVHSPLLLGVPSLPRIGNSSPFVSPSGLSTFNLVLPVSTQHPTPFHLGARTSQMLQPEADAVLSGTEMGAARMLNVPTNTNVLFATDSTTRSNIAPTEIVRNFAPLPAYISSPIKIKVLNQYLAEHPDRELVNFLIFGFSNGFSIRFIGILAECFPSNLKSAQEHPIEVSEAIGREISRGHTSGPFNYLPFPICHCSPLGTVPKGDSVRLILDLSQPRGISVNDGIPQEFASV